MVHFAAAFRLRACFEELGEIPKGTQVLARTGERLLANRLQEGQRPGLR